MAISKGNLKSGTSVIYPRNSLDNIVKSVDSSTAYVTSGGKLLPEYIDTYTSNLSGATVSSNQKKIPTVSAVQMYVSTYTHSANNIPTSAIGNFTTAAKNAASTYVNSSNVIPTTAVNGLTTAITNGASTYVHSNGVIPQSAVDGLAVCMPTINSLVENGAAARVIAGDGVSVTSSRPGEVFGDEIVYDYTVALPTYMDIVTIPAGSSTATIEPGKAYRIDATTTSKTLEIASYDAGKWAREAHIELFVANEGYIHVGSNVDLIDALEPDAVNNCTVRFHDGHAIISVEDHVGAYMVNNTSTGSSTAGTFAYGLKQTANVLYNYIGFRSELNTSAVPTGGATATVLKHIVGNGVGPTITGNLIIKSGATIRDIKASGLVIMSGNATLTNVVCSGLVVSTGGSATFAGSNLVENMQISSGKVFISSGAVVSITSGAIDTGSGTNLVLPIGVQTVEYNTSSMTISHTAAISAAAITSGGSVVWSTGTVVFASSTVVSGGALFMTGNTGNRYAVIYNTGTSLTLRDTVVNARISIAITPTAVRSYGTLVLGGTIFAQDTKLFIDANSQVKGIVRIEDNTTIDITPMIATFVVCQPVETLEIGSNCFIVSSGTTIPLVSGTYTSKGIAHDGTIS